MGELGWQGGWGVLFDEPCEVKVHLPGLAALIPQPHRHIRAMQCRQGARGPQ